jgi:hypothetical protein
MKRDDFRDVDAVGRVWPFRLLFGILFSHLYLETMLFDAKMHTVSSRMQWRKMTQSTRWHRAQLRRKTQVQKQREESEDVLKLEGRSHHQMGMPKGSRACR